MSRKQCRSFSAEQKVAIAGVQLEHHGLAHAPLAHGTRFSSKRKKEVMTRSNITRETRRASLERRLLDVARFVSRPFRTSGAAQLQRNITREVKRIAEVNQADFPPHVVLPENFGRAMPERVVELLLARLLYEPGTKVLDVGHANAMQCHLDLIKALPSPRDITGIDIAEPGYDASAYYRDSILGDIADTGVESNWFHTIWCISALEHFGMDNSGYTGEFSMDSSLPAVALREMLRILKPEGQILVTVPFGRYEDNEWFINYDSEHLQSLLKVARPQSTIHELYFRHTFGSGWTPAAAEELRYVGYSDQANHGAGALAAVIIVKNK
ncbi:MAG: class I SAM-dependent methyltransferase [Pirellulales bacterium]|nr:class I SAM-dependent methyltransferase [Pirellulales bacterium]